MFGAWPALPQQPIVGHVSRDWLMKLALVSAGCGATTVPPYLLTLVPVGVRLVKVLYGPSVTGRVLMVRVPGTRGAAVNELAQCLDQAAQDLPIF